MSYVLSWASASPCIRYPQRIAEAKYDVTEVGCEQSPWVDPILAETRQFAEKLAVAGVGSATRRLMWDKAMAAAAQTLLEGLSHVKCEPVLTLAMTRTPSV